MHNTCHRVGHGPHAVIVLHGWFGDANAFSPIEAGLDGGAFSYVFMDNRGYGGMRGAEGEYSMDEVARDALALADALGFATFSVVGHSMGGMALERLALLAPLRLRKLVAVAPVPCCGVAFDAAARATFLAAADSVAARRAIIDRSTGGRLPATWLDWKAQYSWESSDPAAFAAYFLAWSETDFSEEIKAARVALPLLALVGEHDPRFDAALMRRTYLAWYPQARLEVLGNAGHYPMNETPLALAASIEAFLTEKN
ncbi:alpha/beta hydrolase [Janthinobacterium sp. PLB04]|uniref:Alpha/beta hydrolase n=1 Tax=Janthinobacterium lividum TaxID=29581 RepID=A0AAJ4MNW6_9BURK|nr:MULTISPECIES: alpha/beta hydrolase [Janthinobacterium]KAB0325286.1 alpha/beta hydrolase [Janthinobacterium lividum]QSX94375.1 alpha/beta hydrolase [Janthinobacterium lividum]UGQ34157.1 alpha/beta hydrolase [Janthinobacterium sp. PLB04]